MIVLQLLVIVAAAALALAAVYNLLHSRHPHKRAPRR